MDEAADRLRSHGHAVRVVDQYEGKVFDDYESAMAYVVEVGVDAVVAAVEAVGATVEVFDYPGAGHLFADPSKSDEYQPAEAELMWSRVTDFLERIAR